MATVTSSEGEELKRNLEGEARNNMKPRYQGFFLFGLIVSCSFCISAASDKDDSLHVFCSNFKRSATATVAESSGGADIAGSKRPTLADLLLTVNAKPWRKNECGFWIPSATGLPSGFSIREVTGSDDLSRSLIFDDYCNPFYPYLQRSTVFSHGIDLTALIAGKSVSPEECAFLRETFYRILCEVCEGDWWIRDVTSNELQGKCPETTSQNPLLYDEILRRVQENFPDCPIVDLYVDKVEAIIDFY